MPRPALEVADIFRRHGPAYRAALSPGQRRGMQAIAAGRTAALGGHVEACDPCGHRTSRQGDVGCAGPSRRFPVGDLRADG